MIHVFYHSADLDGHCSGAICKYAMPDAILHGINYGDPFPWGEIKPHDVVYMVDFSLQPFEDMIRLQNACHKFTWIDHHKSAEEEWKASGMVIRGCVLNQMYAACELCWDYLFDENLPRSVYYLGRYDIWKHHDCPGSLEFQYGMRIYDTWPQNQSMWEELFTDNAMAEKIAEQGTLFLRYEREQNKKFASAYAFETELDGLRCIAVNKGFTNSLVFESVYDPERHDAMLSFAYRGEKQDTSLFSNRTFAAQKGFWTVSLYATKPEIDVSVICKAHGGGGHKGAAGFQCDTLPFLKA